MTNTTRTCAYCDAPLTGRANKRYCDTSCRGKDFRHQLASEPDPWQEPAELNEFPPSRSSAHRPPPPRVEHLPGHPAQLAPALSRSSLAAHVSLAIAQSLAEKHLVQLEQHYQRCVEQFLQATEQPQSFRQVRALHTQINAALHAYASHPHRGDATHAAPQRLTELYRLQQLVTEARQELTDRLLNSFWRFGPARIELPIKNKWRAQLKASLPGVA